MPKISLTFEIPDRLTDDVQAQLATELARLHARGYTVRELVTATGKSAKWVRNLLEEAGGNPPRRVPAKPRPRATSAKARPQTRGTARSAPSRRTPVPDGESDLVASIPAPDAIHFDAFAKILGQELRALRKRRGLTRRELQPFLPEEISLQTLATYELGTRHVSAERVYHICRALNEPIEQLYARVRQRLEGPSALSGVWIDIEALTHAPDLGLDPLRAWATSKIAEAPEQPRHVVQLTSAALADLSKICHVEPRELTERLTRANLVRLPPAR